MAIKLDAGEVGRTDIYSIYPKELILVDGDNSRINPHTQEEIESLALSLLENGQLQPILARKVEGNKVKVVVGYGRTKAAQYINTVLQPDKPIKLLVRISDMNAEEAFIKSIVENLDRKNPDPIDDAYAQRILREQYGWSDQKIAEFYKNSVAYIGQLKKTLTLSKEIQQEVKLGNLPISTAITLTDLPEAIRPEVIEANRTETGKIDTTGVNVAVREHKQATGTGGKGRSIKEIKTFLVELGGPAETVATRELAKQLLEFIAGKITDDVMLAGFRGHTKADEVVDQAKAA